MSVRKPFLGADLPWSAAAFAQDALGVGSLATRHARIVRRLSKYSLSSVAAALGGMLTRPELHPCTVRLEALGHLAALACKGSVPVPAENLREWLNGALLDDDVAKAEDPAEDVFVSCVASWDGTSRIFEGIWEGNDFYLQSCLAALNRPGARGIPERTLDPIRALLRLSDAVAERGGIPRQAASEGRPRARIAVTRPGVAEHGGRVTFNRAALHDLGIEWHDLEDFLFDPAKSGRLLDQTIGHTDLERRPLVKTADGDLVLALPTGVSAAIRRLVLDAAHEGGCMDGLRSALAIDQIGRVLDAAAAGWGIDPTSRPTFRADAGVHEFFGEFDRGAWAHVVLVHDDLRAARTGGLQSFHEVSPKVDALVVAGAAELQGRPGFRRGMTVLIHGGIGRGFAAGFSKLPEGWHLLPVSLHDFTLLGRASGFSAMRAWKLLRHVEEVAKDGVQFMNPGGFVNMYGYAEDQDFEIVPPEAEADTIYLAPSFVLGLRTRLRRAYDHHAARSFEDGGWIEVERRTPQAFFESGRNLPLFVVPTYAAEGVLAGCTETARRTFWMLCQVSPSDMGLRSLVFQVWDMALNWLPRCAACVETLKPGLTDLVSFELEFPDLPALDHRLIESRPFARPSVEATGALVRIGCGAAYLAAFASPENLGDRWMVGAIIDGAARVAGAPLDAVRLEALVEEVVRGTEARFFHTVPVASEGQAVHVTSLLPPPRLVQPEDRFRSRLGLARLAGFGGASGPLPRREASDLLGEAVDVLWIRIRDLLVQLDRASVIETALAELEAVEKERAVWRLTASAVVALHGSGSETLATVNQRESDRSRATTSLRALVEMAVCTAPLAGGLACSKIDLDGLCADIAALIEAANVKDALHYGLAEGALVVNPNMAFGVESTLSSALRGGYFEARGDRAFLGAAEAYASRFPDDRAPRKAVELNPDFTAAWSAEFGTSLDDVAKVVGALADLAVKAKAPVLRMRRSQVLEAAAAALGLGPAGAARIVDSLSLKPRPRCGTRPSPATLRAGTGIPGSTGVGSRWSADPSCSSRPGTTPTCWSARRCWSAASGTSRGPTRRRFPARCSTPTICDAGSGRPSTARATISMSRFATRSGHSASWQRLRSTCDGWVVAKELGDVDVLAWKPGKHDGVRGGSASGSPRREPSAK